MHEYFYGFELDRVHRCWGLEKCSDVKKNCWKSMEIIFHRFSNNFQWMEMNQMEYFSSTSCSKYLYSQLMCHKTEFGWLDFSICIWMFHSKRITEILENITIECLLSFKRTFNGDSFDPWNYLSEFFEQKSHILFSILIRTKRTRKISFFGELRKSLWWH